MNYPLISVVMSVYNEEAYLEQSITSILNQTFRGFEFIIIDDASTDNTAEIVNTFCRRDSRIRCMTNSTNLGLTPSLNLGLNEARGRFIARMDGNDVSAGRRFEKQAAFLEKHPHYHLVGTRSFIIDEKGKTVGRLSYPASYRDIVKMLPNQSPFVHSSVMFRKETVMSVGGYNEDFKYAQDYEMWGRWLLFFKGANLTQYLHSWRRDDNGISRRKRRVQRIYGDAVIGRYRDLYRLMDSRSHSPQLSENIYAELLEISHKCADNPLFKMTLQRLLESRLSAGKKIVLLTPFVKRHFQVMELVIRLLKTKKYKPALEIYQLASLYQMQKEYAKAAQLFHQVKNSRKKTIKAGAYFHLGELEWTAGNLGEARRYFQKTLSLWPSHRKAARYLEEIGA